MGRQTSNIYWIAFRRGPEDAVMRASALMDLFAVGALMSWLLPEEAVRKGGDLLEPPDAAETPLLSRFLGTYHPQSVYKRPPRMGWWCALSHGRRPPPAHCLRVSAFQPSVAAS